VPGLLEFHDGGFLGAGFIQIINGYSYIAFVFRTDAKGRLGEQDRTASDPSQAMALVSEEAQAIAPLP